MSASLIVTLGNDEYFIKLIVGNNRRIKFSSKVLWQKVHIDFGMWMSFIMSDGMGWSPGEQGLQRGPTLPHPRWNDPRPRPQSYLLMYSPVRTLPQDLHLKQPKCHCFSRARSACPFLISRPQPAQSGKKAATSGYSTFVLLNPSTQACSEPQCVPITHSINIYSSTISFRVLSLHETCPGGLAGPILTQDGNVINLRGSKGMDVLHQFISLGVM